MISHHRARWMEDNPYSGSHVDLVVLSQKRTTRHHAVYDSAGNTKFLGGIMSRSSSPEIFNRPRPHSGLCRCQSLPVVIIRWRDRKGRWNADSQLLAFPPTVVGPLAPITLENVLGVWFSKSKDTLETSKVATPLLVPEETTRILFRDVVGSC